MRSLDRRRGHGPLVAERRPSWHLLHAAGLTVLTLLLGATLAVGVAGIVATWRGWGGLFESFALAELSLGLPWAAVGLYLAARRPANPVGWVLLLAGISGLADRGTTALGELGIAPPVGGAVVAVMAAVPAPPLPVLPALALVLFPDGRPPSRRWWWLVTPVVATGLVAAVGIRIAPTSPFFLGVFWNIASGAGAVLLLAGVVALVQRHRRGDAVIRLQARGVLLAMVVTVAIFATFVALRRPWIGNPAFALVPVSIGVAIVRHQLYDLDRLVSRVVAYAVVVAALAACYLGSVLVLGGIARAMTGEAGDLVVALSTLAVAALFQPLRRRVQSVVDRRFNRARYDGVRTVQAFGRSLRDEIRSEAVVDGLRVTVRETLAPTSASVQLVERRRP